MPREYIDILYCVIFLLAAIPATFLDIRAFRIPDWASLGGIAALLALGALDWPWGFLWRLSGAALGAGFFLLARAIARGRLGYGDVKLAGTAGAFLGPLLWTEGLLLACAAALCYALIRSTITKEKASGIRLPFAPFISFGALAAFAFPLTALMKP